MASGERPTIAGALLLLGGAAVVVEAFALSVGRSPIPRSYPLPPAFWYAGIEAGLLAGGAGALLLAVPAAGRWLGPLGLACAAASVPLADGGLGIGFALTAVGGAMAVAHSRRAGARGSTPRSPPWT